MNAEKLGAIAAPKSTGPAHTESHFVQGEHEEGQNPACARLKVVGRSFDKRAAL